MAAQTSQVAALKGHDPLADLNPDSLPFTRDSTKLEVQNILKSYTHTFDVFCESIQNALDAIEGASRQSQSSAYKPRLWIRIDIQGRSIRVVDNGVGMSLEEFKYCFRPNVSFKLSGDYRGQKGVGSTFLAYGFSFVKLQTKKSGELLSAALRGGRLWANDHTGKIPRPVFEATEWTVSELEHELAGTAIELTIGKEAGERPGDLGWLGAVNAEQWRDVLRIKTPLGQVFLTGKAFSPSVYIEVIDSTGIKTAVSDMKCDYFYPHEIPSIKQAYLDEVTATLAKIDGDSQTKMRKLSDDYKRLNCLWKIWETKEIVDNTSSLRIEDFSLEEIALCERHSIIAYGAFVNSLDVFDTFSDQILHLRKKQRILRGGLQMATDHMVQGDLITIPLLRATGYQHQTHVLVHFTEGNPDLGRKIFQPEYQTLAEKIAKAAVQTFLKFRAHLRPDTGTAQMLPDRELQNWMREQDDWRKKEALRIFNALPGISMISNPREEQDVIALFHELVGAGILKGYAFLSSKFNDRYDGLFETAYDSEDIHFDEINQPLGVSREIPIGFQSATQVLEYKFDLDSLASDFDRQLKFANHVDLAVCWRISLQNLSKLEFRSLLIGTAGEIRQHFGATHSAYIIGNEQPIFEIIVLEDLVNFLVSREDEIARQKSLYAES